MMRRIVLIVAALSAVTAAVASENGVRHENGKPVRQVASRCEQLTEAQRIAKFADTVSRRGDVLFFRLKDGTTVSRKNSERSAGHCDCEGNANVSYTFHDFIDPWYVIKEGYYESHGTEFINRDTGAVVNVSGRSKFSPDKARFLAVGYGGESPCDTEIWKLSRAGIVREWQTPCSHSFRWSDSLTVEVAGHEEVIARLKHDGISWQCSGSPQVCDEVEATSPWDNDTDGNATGKPGLMVQKRDPDTSEEIYVTHPPNSRVHVATREKSDDSTLVAAAAGGDSKEVKRLLDDGADVNAEGADGKTPLMAAAWEGHLQEVKLLLSKGADVNARDEYCSTALNGPLNTSWTDKSAEVVKLLLENGADANAKDNHGRTALWAAISANNLEVIKLLAENGANVNELVEAVFRGHLAAVKLLLDQGADVNMKYAGGRTALMQAVERGPLEVVRLLLDKGADVNLEDEHGWTALTYAANKEKSEVIDLLLNRGAKVTLTTAACLGDAAAVQRLTKKGDGHKLKATYDSAMILAAQRGHWEIVKMLLDKGADVNAKVGDNAEDGTGQTSLMFASSKRNLEMVKMLLDKGADVNATGYYCQTALFMACESGSEEVMKLLRAHGAKEPDSKKR